MRLEPWPRVSCVALVPTLDKSPDTASSHAVAAWAMGAAQMAAEDKRALSSKRCIDGVLPDVGQMVKPRVSSQTRRQVSGGPVHTPKWVPNAAANPTKQKPKNKSPSIPKFGEQTPKTN